MSVRGGWGGSVVSVEECDAGEVLVAWTRVGRRRVYSHADGGVGCVSQEVKGPGGAFVGGEGVGSSVCLDLYDERDVRWQDDVVGCLVEVAGCLVHWDGEDQVCAVVARPGCEPVLEGQGDALASVGGFYGEVVDHGDVVKDRLGVVVESESSRVVGFLFGGSDEGGSYEVAVAPRSYQFPVQVVVPVGEGFWERNEAWVGDLFGDEGVDRLYFFLRRGGSDVEPGGLAPAGGPVEESCQGAEDVASHGGFPFSGTAGGSRLSSWPGGGGAPSGLGGRAPGRASSRPHLIVPTTCDTDRGVLL